VPTLSEYVNVYNSALNALRKKGFQVWRDEELFCAERGGWDFMADSPIALLGLAALFDEISPKSYEEYWWRNEQGMDYLNLPTEPRPFVSVMTRPGDQQDKPAGDPTQDKPRK
jgi:hypothetical protein